MLSSLQALGIERARVYALDDTVAGKEVGEKLRHALPSVQVTRLTDAELPAHARIVEHQWRGHYAWKPVIIQHALTSEADGVLWVDAGESVEKASAVADLVDPEMGQLRQLESNLATWQREVSSKPKPAKTSRY